jgi:hypothetical protein
MKQQRRFINNNMLKYPDNNNASVNKHSHVAYTNIACAIYS